MSNNFRKTAVLKKKKKNCKLKLLRFFWDFFFQQIFGAVAVLKIFSRRLL